MPSSRSPTNNIGRRPRRTVAAASLLLMAVQSSAFLVATTSAFSSSRSRHGMRLIASRTNFGGRRDNAGRLALLRTDDDDDDIDIDTTITTTPTNKGKGRILSTMTAASLAIALATNPMVVQPEPAFAYEESDYASETVTAVVSQLKSTAGDADGTFKTLEEVAKIITEGKGVGGTLTYDGVRLVEGAFVADEDTTIYNPGLSLLTSSEKERLVSAVVQSRNVGLSTPSQAGWSENNEFAFDFLKQKLDPLHMYELGGYLKILPFWGAGLYLAALFVQKNARDVFPLVYGLCALGVFGPVIVLVGSGP